MTDSGPPQEKDAPLMTAPTTEAITAQVSRIVASAVFAKSARLSAYLRFIVDETLAGRVDRLKEYTIALEVYGRDESFDPRVDSIVRVEAGRLRAKIRDYDDTIGRDDLVRIGLRIGSYVPDFRTAAGQSAPGQHSAAARAPGLKRTRAPWPVYAILVSILAVLGAGGRYLYYVR